MYRGPTHLGQPLCWSTLYSPCQENSFEGEGGMAKNPIQVSNVAVISIYVSNLDRARSFYVDVLGLEDRGDMGPGCMLALSDTSFYLEPGRNPNPGNRALKAADVSICFDVDSVKAAFREAEKRELPIVMSYTEYSPEYAVFMLSDPDGNVTEFAGSP
jgi:predicted enzyme related to lactoylglutathione lyase